MTSKPLFPHPVPAVRAIIPDAGGRVLLLKRAASSTRGGYWCLPGGKVDYGETLEQAVRREVLEETGLGCTGLRFLFYQDSLPFEDGGMHCINLYFECATEGVLQLDAESVAYAWIGRSELDGYTVAFRNEEGVVSYWEDLAEK